MINEATEPNDDEVRQCLLMPGRETFDGLLDCLRSKGVQGQKPFHQLRKLFGSAVAEAHGIHVASASLRHADLSTTTQFYSDRTLKLTAGFAVLFPLFDGPGDG